MVDGGNPDDLDGLDPMRNKTTIFVDPRDYATVPMPGDLSGAASLSNGADGSSQSNGSRFQVPGAKGTLLKPKATGQSSVQSEEAREQRKQRIREIPLGSEALSSTKLDRNGAKSSGGSGSGGLFIAPEREGYRGLDVNKLSRGTIEGDNVKHNLWLNDVARNDRDGLPLAGRAN
ncbi:MAG: hypothetical protein HC779_03555 [Phyllobacteriaceae bacterium]|nr:hypothetical protein [Phyllobacteriaceae bacterium]